MDLPDGILYGIAWHFTLKEWAVGPAQASRSLYRMLLPRIVLNISECIVSYSFPLVIYCRVGRQAYGLHLGLYQGLNPAQAE